ncbi:RNA polymerase sigma factor [Georgenia sunbinii]|uniref:RNA polymerase sigma factor n=1 Tax=Georgenia sunbinii TaxID=3117728 RepID=UPI002F269678
MRDEAWFDEHYRAHSVAVYRYFVRRAPGADAEDLAADVFATAWRRRDDVPAEAVLPWLYRTAGFVLANYRRKQVPVPVETLPDVTDDDDPALAAVADDDVRRALRGLSDRDRTILMLHAWEGLVGESLAAALEISRGGADAALSRARSRLAALWQS